MDKYCETKLISKMDMYFETEEVFLNELIVKVSRFGLIAFESKLVIRAFWKCINIKPGVQLHINLTIENYS